MLATPASMQTVDAGGVEDNATWSFQAVHRIEGILSRLRLAIAAEMLMAAQAIYLREDIRLGSKTDGVLSLIRSVSAPVEQDRSLGAEVEELAGLIRMGRFSDDRATGG